MENSWQSVQDVFTDSFWAVAHILAFFAPVLGSLIVLFLIVGCFMWWRRDK